MKKLTLMLVGLATVVSSFAQKVDLDKSYINYVYRGLPHKPLDTNYRTFNVRVEAPSTINSAMSAESIADRIVLQGWRKAEYGKGHIQITMNFDDLMFEGQNITTRVSETKNKDGVVTSTKTYYTLTVKYRLSAYYSIRDYQGNTVLGRSELATDRTASWSSQEFNSSYEAQNYFNNNRGAISNNLVRKHLDEWTNTLNNSLNHNYGFPTNTEMALFWTMDSKKHPENQAWIDQLATVKKLAAEMDQNNLSEATKKGLTECMNYYKSVIEKYNTDEKAHVKLRYAAYYNMARIALMIDNPSAVAEFAKGLESTGYDVKDAEKLEKDAKELSDLFTLNKINSTHFPIDINKYKTPSGF